jgi:dipeptidyl-peptidase-4
MKIRLYLVLTLLVQFSLVNAQQYLTLEEAVMGPGRQFAPESIDQLKWVKNTETYMYVEDKSVYVSGPGVKNQAKKLISLEDLNNWKGGGAMTAIPNINWLNEHQFTFTNVKVIYEADVKQKSVRKRLDLPTDAKNSDYHSGGNRMAYTIENNLYVATADKVSQITQLGKDVVAGQSISRNEYGISKGTFWNNDGSKLAFYQKDETKVSNYPLTNYNTVPASVSEIKYPFAGQPSEHVSVGVYDVQSGNTIYLRPSNSEGDQFYLTNLGWAPDNKTIYLAWMNRQTTHTRLLAFNSETGEEIKELFSEKDEKWVEPQRPVTFIPNKNDRFIWFSRREGFTNAYLYDTNGKLHGQTGFKFDILSLVGFDKKGENMFVMATGENPTNTMCYKVNLKSMSATLVTKKEGVHQVQISTSGANIIDSYSSLGVAQVIDLIDGKGNVRNLKTSKNPLADRMIGKTELFTIKATNGTDLWCRLIKPSNFDASKKYPVVVYVYNGPHAQLVTNNFLGGASLWMNYLAEKGYLVFTVDGQGSANRGRDFEQIIYRQLGTQEIEDQMVGVEWLKSQPYVDASRMAVHGWSYGGFMTTSIMLRKPGVFKVGVAGGPVIDWALYEVMYCERYMDTPQENPEGYKASDVTQYVKNLQGDLLMIHGADDDVVVMQHNMKFLKACVDNQVQVDFFAYPGHAHNVRGKDRVHLIQKIIDYIEEKLEE